MDSTPAAALPTRDDLLAIIRIQTEIIGLGLDLDAVIAGAVRGASELAEADGAAVELVEDGVMIYRAGHGIAEAQIGLTIPIAGSLSGLSVETGQTLYCEDAERDPRVNAAACHTVGLRSMVVVPLRFEQSVVGVLKVMSVRPSAFGPKQIEILRLIADFLAAATYFSTRCQSDALFHRATHDFLTGLANRALFLDRLRNAVHLAGRDQRRSAVLVIDMDGFKQINDRHGHRAGDMAIREFARRLEHATRKSDTVARLGGDEFGVVLAPSPDPSNIHTTIARLSAAIDRPFVYEDHHIDLHASVGAAFYPDDATDIDGLIEKADQAMYTAKQTRRPRPTG